MSSKIYYHDSNYTVVISNEIIEQMVSLCRDKHPLETGGILIGSYTEDYQCALINYITGPPKDSRHRTHEFYRGTHKLKSLLSSFWDQGHFYLGEWHFHPNSSPTPSWVDRKQMRQISSDANYKCPEPILFILGGDPSTGWQTSCSIFPKDENCIILMEDE